MTSRWFTREALLAMIDAGEVSDVTTVAALHLFDRHAGGPAGG